MHCYILNIEALGPKVLEKILSFPHYKSLEANEPQGMANLDPRGMVGWIYVRDH